MRVRWTKRARAAIRERLGKPYRILYTVQAEDIFILAVYHGRRLLPDDSDDL